MKKILKLSIINLLTIILILILGDYIILANSNYKVLPFYPQLEPRLTTGSVRYENNLPYDKNKGSIITIGCSFVEGTRIADNETLSYQLQKLTKRKTYNTGVFAGGLQHILFQLDYSLLYDQKKISPAPEYIIYVFIPDHLRRLNVDYFSEKISTKYLQYNIKNGKFQLKDSTDITFMDYIKVTRLYKNIKDLIFILTPDDKKFNQLKTYLVEIKNRFDKKFDNTKFIIIVYNPNLDLHKQKPFHTTRWNELEDEGFIIVNLDTPEYDYLNTPHYLAIDRVHPGAKAWESLVPKLVNILNLN